MKTITKQFTYDGIDYIFYGLSNEHIFKQIPWYEFQLLNYLRELNLNGTYIDVGGNIGNHSVFFLNHCNSTNLITFEPENMCHDILTKNLITNTTKPFIIHKLAAWKNKTKLKLVRFESFGNTGTSFVEEIKDDKSDINYINANSIDNLIESDSNVVLLKIDAEGSEPFVLKGALNIIKSKLPVIICEATTQPEYNEINKILLPLGYNKPTKQFNSTPTYVWIKKEITDGI